MRYEILSHRQGVRSVPVADRMNVENLLDSLIFADGKLMPKEVTDPIRQGLIALGWSSNVAIGQGTNISIASVHKDVGMAIQFGNISRIYADLMKLQTLYIEEKISSGIIIVPHRDLISRLSKSGGLDNRCSFNRLVRELPIFSKIITIPIIVYGVYTEDENEQ